MRIGFDVDGVLANYIDSFLNYHNRIYGTFFEMRHVTRHDLSHVLQISSEEADKRVSEFFVNKELVLKIAPFEEARDCISRLYKGNELYVITSRHEDSEHETLRWIDKHYPRTFKDVFFSSKAMPKSHYCKELELDIFVEDNIKYARECAKEGIATILLGNLDISTDEKTVWEKEGLNLTRAFSWKEIPQIISSYNLTGKLL